MVSPCRSNYLSLTMRIENFIRINKQHMKLNRLVVWSAVDSSINCADVSRQRQLESLFLSMELMLAIWTFLCVNEQKIRSIESIIIWSDRHNTSNVKWKEFSHLKCIQFEMSNRDRFKLLSHSCRYERHSAIWKSEKCNCEIFCGFFCCERWIWRNTHAHTEVHKNTLVNQRYSFFFFFFALASVPMKNQTLSELMWVARNVCNKGIR